MSAGRLDSVPDHGVGIKNDFPTEVIFIIRSLAIGGAERQIVTTANALAARGYKITLIVLSSSIELASDIELDRLNFILIDKKSRWNIGGWIVKLAGYLRSVPKAVVFGWLPSESLISFFISNFFTKHRYVWSVRASTVNYKEYDWLTSVVYRAHRFLVRSRSGDAVVFNSYAGAEVYGISAAEFRCHVIWNAVDQRVFHPSNVLRKIGRTYLNLDESVPLVGIFGRLIAAKDHHTFLMAAKHLNRQHPDIRFMIVGGGEEGGRLIESKVRSMGLDGVVLMTGASRHIPELLNAADVVVSTSKNSEGVQNTLIEAMCCGRPIVASEVGDVRHFISEFDLMVPPGDSDGVAASILTLLSTDTAEMRDKRSAYANRIFSIDRMTNEFSKLIDSLNN